MSIQLSASNFLDHQATNTNQLNVANQTKGAQSSGTSYEPSVDFATISNVHSTDYHQEASAGELIVHQQLYDFYKSHDY